MLFYEACIQSVYKRVPPHASLQSGYAKRYLYTIFREKCVSANMLEKQIILLLANPQKLSVPQGTVSLGLNYVCKNILSSARGERNKILVTQSV
jgi:hypothetical protein